MFKCWQNAILGVRGVKMFWGSCNLAVCQSVWHCGIGNDRMPGIAALGIPRGPALLYNGDFECQGVWHCFCLNAKGSGIGNATGSAIAFASMPRGVSLTSFLGYLITGLHAIMQLDCRAKSNHAMGEAVSKGCF